MSPVLAGLMAWALGSIPLGILVGKAIAIGSGGK
jgi:hypothetical protein